MRYSVNPFFRGVYNPSPEGFRLDQEAYALRNFEEGIDNKYHSVRNSPEEIREDQRREGRMRLTPFDLIALKERKILETPNRNNGTSSSGKSFSDESA